jgi:arylsulfatase A-like enzyme
MGGNRRIEATSSSALFIGCALAFTGAAACSPPKPLVPPKHVVLLVIDTQRADRLSCYGNRHPVTPNLDALAREGVRFENAVSQCSWTSPSMVSMMSSGYIAEEGFSIPADKTTLAEVFKKAGWSTGAFICNDLLSEDNHFDRGFDVFEWKLTPYSPNDPIIDWIQKTKDERSFTFVHLNEVHDPYHPPWEWTHYRTLQELPSPERMRYFDEVSAKLGLQDREPSVRKITAELGGYDDDVNYCDTRIRGIFDAIKAAGIWDSTAILVGADHGEGLFTRVQYLEGTRFTAHLRGEPPTLFNSLQMTHGSQVNWELVHVPMILKAPGLPAGSAIPGYVENVDIAPTLIDLAGLAIPSGAQGRSLVPLARDPTSRAALDASLKDSVFTHTRFVSSIITPEGYQFIHPTEEGICAFELQDELYDLHADPEERENLASSKPDLVNALKTLVAQHMKIGIRGNTTVTARTLKSLQGLGYTNSGVVASVRDELAKAETAELLDRLGREGSCLMRLEISRALKERALSATERDQLTELKKKQPSSVVRDMIDAALKAR